MTKKYPPIICKRCKCEFEPRSGYTLYCDDCRPIVKKERNRKKVVSSDMSWSEIIRVCEDNKCTYGQAVARGLLHF